MGFLSKKIVWIPLLIAAVLALAACFAVPHLLFSFIFGKPSRTPKIPKSYVDTPHYKVSRAGMALIKSLPNSDHYITSRDGLKLHGYLFPMGEEPLKKFVIGVHGYKSYSRPECAPYIEFYRSLGYSMLMVDDRAHRPSEGEYIGFGVPDRLDVVDWCRYLVETYGEDIEIYLHGVSMGAATVLSASGEADLPQQVKGIVSDCGFSTPWAALSYQLKETSHLPAADFFLRRVEHICQKKAGYNFHDISALEQVKKAKVPILFVQGGKDWMVPPYMARELYDACASEKKLLEVPQAGHGESIAFAPEEYHTAIRTLFHI